METKIQTRKNMNGVIENLEQILAVVRDPAKRIVARHKVGLDVTKEVYKMVSNPKNIGSLTGDADYEKMLKILEEGGVLIPHEAVESCINSAHPCCFEYGLTDGIKAYLSPHSIKRKGIEVYNWMVREQEKQKSDDIESYAGYRKERVVSSFGLSKEDTLQLDRRVFKNTIVFSPTGDVYRLTRTSTELVNGIPSYSRVKQLQEKLGLNQDQVSDIIGNFVRDVIKGKPVSIARRFRDEQDRKREETEMAYGMLLEFGGKLGLTETEERELAGMYKSTPYAKMEFVEKYFPDEVAQWRKNKGESHKNEVFELFYPESRNRIKQFELFNSERFRKYDQACFRNALEEGNFKFAYEIASERGYKEKTLLERLI